MRSIRENCNLTYRGPIVDDRTTMLWAERTISVFIVCQQHNTAYTQPLVRFILACLTGYLIHIEFALL